jgi:lysophospholipase L1-like esterase
MPVFRAFCLLVLIAACCGDASAQPPSPAESCLAAGETLSLGAPLPRTAALLRSGGPLKIVAMGSSSTVSLWMRDPARTYPGVMQAELMRLRPAVRVEVVNSGKNADTIPGNIARFERDVFAHRPDLVIWQVGTNDFTWVESADSLTARITRGVRMLRAGGAEVILMDQQYAPVILASQYAKMQAAIADAARRDGIALFGRFDLMRRAVDGGLSIGALVSWDGLHLSADGYDCVGRALARAIAR